jgi:YD repeat-containing protein
MNAAATRDCYIVSGAGAATSHCREGVLKVGSDSGAEYRALLRFDLSGVPPQSQIVDATLGLSTASCPTSAPISLTMQRLSSDWGQVGEPTWNLADLGVSSAWATPGGDVTGEAIPRSTALTSSCTDAWFFPARLLQAWAEGAPNLGVIIREPRVSRSDVLPFASSRAADPTKRPFLDVEYRPRTGDTQPYTIEHRDLSDRTTIGVNVANGNLVVRERDIEFFDTDVDYPVDRTYNNLAHQFAPLGTTVLGAGWSQSFDRRISMPPNLTSRRTTVNGPTGELLAYTYDDAGGFIPVGAIRPQLLWGDTYLRVSDPDTGTRIEFSPSTYSLQSRVDPRGNDISYDKTSRAPITAITDPLGRRTSFTIGAGNVLRSMTDPNGGTHTYGYDPNGYLISYTHPIAGTTRYAYADADKNLTSITTPDGTETRMTYDAQMRVRTVTRVTDPIAGTGETTSYDYATGSTTSTDPTGRVRRYWYDGASRVTRTTDGAQPPIATVSGPLSDARGTTLPAGITTLSLGATNPAGISDFRIDLDGVPVDERPQDCETACPTTATADWTLNTADYEGGTYTVNILTTAANGDVSSEAFPITLPAQTPFTDGTLPGDTEPTPDQEEPITTDDCESYYGRGSDFCIDPAAPLAAPALADGSAAALRSTSSLIYGISQDGPTGIPSLRLFEDLRVKRVRRIVNYNLMEQESPGRPAEIPGTNRRVPRLLRAVTRRES